MADDGGGIRAEEVSHCRRAVGTHHNNLRVKRISEFQDLIFGIADGHMGGHSILGNAELFRRFCQPLGRYRNSFIFGFHRRGGGKAEGRVGGARRDHRQEMDVGVFEPGERIDMRDDLLC